MFVWLKLLGVDDSKTLIKEKAVEKRVLLLPGVEFYPNPCISAHVRASFSTATESEMDEALSRLASILREAQNK
jgi:kynurenine/2-aminoadipate aminotransferase